jgi:hypothetical protein
MKTARSLLRRTTIASAALAAATAVTAVATPEAHADAATSGATAVASFLGGKIISGVANLGVSFLWDAVFSDASSSGLTATDVASIQTIVDDELDAHELASEKNAANAVLSLASEYHRGTTSAELDAAEAKLIGDTGNVGILDATNTLLQNLKDDGMEGSSTYIIMASLRVAFLKELYEVDYARNVLVPGTYSDSTLGGDLADVASQASAVLTQLQSFEATFDAQFGSVSKYTYNDDYHANTDGCRDGNGTKRNGWEASTKYCFSGPDGKTCGSSFDVYKCKSSSYGPTDYTAYTPTDELASLAEANILRQQAKMAYRDSQLAPQYYELKRNLTRIADYDFEYCGNGTCGIGEIDSCADDCAGQFDEIGHFSHTTWGDGTLLSTGEARLDWQRDGNLVLYDTTTSPESVRWQADLGGTTGYKLVFQSSNGDLVIRDSSNTILWESGTSDLDSYSRLVLLGKTLYIVDGDGTLHGTGQPAWSSDEDSHRYAEVEDRFCYDTSAAKVLAMSTTGTLKWSSGGYLETIDRSAGERTWSTGTSGAYLCNQEDGNLVIYSSTGTTLWSSGTSRGVGGHLVIVGDQLRTTTDSGDLLWTSPVCSMASCTQDNRVASRSTSTFVTLTKSQAQTLLENDKARLDWESTGNLALYNKATGAKIYESATAGTGAKLVYGPNGLMVQTSSNLVKWQLAPAGQAGSIVLADCNLFAPDYSTGEALGATNTICDDTAN